MVNTKIRLITFFAAKAGEALYSQQKQDQELTVAQIMNSLLPYSDFTSLHFYTSHCTHISKHQDLHPICVCVCVFVCVCVDAKSLQSCPALFDPIDCSQQGSSVHGDYSGKNTRVLFYALLQGIFLTQGSNPLFMFPVLADKFFTTSNTWEAHIYIYIYINFTYIQ